MGDRGNIIIEKENGPALFLYTHWTGSELPEILKAALTRGEPRWTDSAYLARIIFSEMIKDNVLEETGFGISTTEGDGGTDIHVNVTKQTVSFMGETKSFRDYIK